MKLQLNEGQSFSLFDGEIVVAEGVYDANTSRLNVAKIHKLDVQSMPRSNPNIEELQKMVNENYKDRAVQVMVACGPFTVKNSLSYQGLIDFLSIARKEQPQAVILMGPFLDTNN